MKKQKNRNTLSENANLSNLSRAGVQAFDIICLGDDCNCCHSLTTVMLRSTQTLQYPLGRGGGGGPSPWERFFIWIATTYVQISLAIFKPANNHVVVLHVVRCNFWKSKSNPASGVNSQTKRYFVVLIVKFPPEKESIVVKGMSKLGRRTYGKTRM